MRGLEEPHPLCEKTTNIFFSGKHSVRQSGIFMIQSTDGGYIVSINKPEGWSSFDVVKKIRRITGIKKVGHAGTLDPFATGILLICLEKATKKSADLMELPKEYEAEIQLGKTTDTLDKTGKITAETTVPSLNEAQIRKALAEFIGPIRQKIPAYSASKISGQRSYHLARKGKKIPERYKSVYIYELELLNYRTNMLKIRVLCSRGTYIRTLGFDIAQKLGTAGFLIQLCRTRIGDYQIYDALSPEEFEKVWQKPN
jgi:tRNA pseudouridine55 synthase